MNTYYVVVGVNKNRKTFFLPFCSTGYYKDPITVNDPEQALRWYKEWTHEYRDMYAYYVVTITDEELEEK